MVMKYRSISGCVTVTGPPRAICRLNTGMTDPRLPSTFPNPTDTTGFALQQRRRLVGRGMEHHLGLMAAENCFHPDPVADIRNDRGQGQFGVVLSEREERFENAVFPVPEQYDL